MHQPRRSDYHATNYAKLLKSQSITARKGSHGKAWTIDGIQVSVMRREDAGVDGDEPWIASCDTHGQMIACPTKVLAIQSAKHRDWCYDCNKSLHR